MAELSAESERDAFREFFVKVARSQIVSPHSQFKERVWRAGQILPIEKA